jgi:phosphoribosylaminoimidazole-succinocarboxamide synthase
MTPSVVEGITNRYIELYEHITGEKFVRYEDDDILARIEKNINAYLNNR